MPQSEQNTWQYTFNKFKNRQAQTSSTLILLNPNIETLPLGIQRFDDPFLPLCREIINATQDVVTGYILDFPAFMALGAAGARALERTIGVIGFDIPKILHIGASTPAYSQVVERTAFDVDAITITNADLVNYYLTHAPYAPILLSDSDKSLREGGYWNIKTNDMGLTDIDAESLSFKVTPKTFLANHRQADFAQTIRQKVTDNDLA